MTEEQRLVKRLADQQKLLDQERKNKKPKLNERMEEDTPDRLDSYDFWCDNCQEDFTAPCYKTRHYLYGDVIAVWRATCPECGEQCIRHITHRDHDLYYQKSAKIRRQRNEYAWEMLQAGEYGFNTRYGNPYREYEEMKEKSAKKRADLEREQGLKNIL